MQSEIYAKLTLAITSQQNAGDCILLLIYCRLGNAMMKQTAQLRCQLLKREPSGPLIKIPASRRSYLSTQSSEHLIRPLVLRK